MNYGENLKTSTHKPSLNFDCKYKEDIKLLTKLNFNALMRKKFMVNAFLLFLMLDPGFFRNECNAHWVPIAMPIGLFKSQQTVRF